jgi:Origin of replication binding protein
MLGVYNTIYKPNRQHDPKTVLENHFTLDEISALFTVRKQEGNFEVYPNYSDFFKKLDTVPPAEHQYHEVIFEQKQKIKCDIDATLGKLIEFAVPAAIIEEGGKLTPEEKFWHIIDVIVDAVKTAFFVSYGSEINRIILCTSIGNIDGVPKYGAHLIIDGYYVNGCAQAQEFTRRFLEYVPNVYKTFVDSGVNKRVQNFRITGCHKGDGRVKKITRVITSNENGCNENGCNENGCNDSATGHTNATVHNSACNNSEIACNDICSHKSKVTREDTLITYITGSTELPDLIAGAPISRFNTKMCTGDIEKTLQICAENGILRDNRFNCVRNGAGGGMFIFTRLRPSHCELCERTHDSDNTVIVNTAPGPEDTIYVYKGCRKYKQERGGVGIRIGTFTSGVAGGLGGVGTVGAIGVGVGNGVGTVGNGVGTVGTGTTEGVIMNYGEREISAAVIDPDSLYPVRTLFDDLPVGYKNVYDENALKDFELSRTLVVHAAMKMGKTKALRKYVDSYFASKLRRDIIRYVSFRQTFSGNIKEKFGDFTLYSDVAGPLSQDKLIIQVESLHRMEIGIEPPDLLILDECESIFEQFDSGLLRSFNESFAKFQYLLKYSKHVICMDAGISDRTFRIIEAIRGTEGITYHHCVHKNAVGDKYYVTADKGKWFGMLYTALGAGERVAISISSLTEARAIEAGVKKKFPEKIVKLYSSETLQSEKREHFADVNTYWQQCDILMYTPTVSAGVSFEVRHFNRCFGYFTDQSCPVETCMQMIGRIRDVSTHEFVMYLAATGASLPVDIEEIRTGVYQRRENLMKTFDETGLRVEYGAAGEVRYHASTYFTIWLENARVRNLSKNAFIRRFIHVVSRAGAVMYHLDEATFKTKCGLSADEICELIVEHTGTRAEITDTMCAEIAESRDIDDDEAEIVRGSLRAQSDVPRGPMRCYEKYLLRTNYHFTGEITPAFVRTYRDPKVRRIFRNLLRIGADPDPMRAVIKIQDEERAVYNHSMQGEERTQYSDIARRYVFDQHRYAIGLMQLCGWKTLEDRSYQHTVMFAEVLRQRERSYWDVIEAACREFQIRVPSRIDARVNRESDAAFIGVLTRPVSKVLNIMYGVRIVTKQKDPDMWYLTRMDLFTINPECADKKPLLKMPEFEEPVQ